MLKGMIVKNISDTYTVKESKNLYECKARGKFRNSGLTPLVGDIVEFDPEQNYILDIMERKNELARPSVSNIDVALIISSVKKPDLSLYLLDKQITSVSLENIEPVLCFTKLDLLSRKELKEVKKIMKYYKKLGYAVFTNWQIKKILRYLKGKTVVLTGQTGAGKSSLLNLISPSLNLKTGEISEALGRGKHTTRHTEFFLVKDVLIADTPGFSSLDINRHTKEEIRDTFLEFKKYTCEFKNCMHDKEQNCAVREACEKGEIMKSRYENYCNFIRGGK